MTREIVEGSMGGVVAGQDGSQHAVVPHEFAFAFIAMIPASRTIATGPSIAMS